MELGQVFTSKKVAKLMADLFKPHLKENNQVMDPCIGQNIFLNEFTKLECNNELTGIEIDDVVITKDIIEFFEKDNRNFISGDFFDFDLSNKFDFIIMNPPYVRQERIQYTNKCKEEMNSILNEYFPNIPSKSNLYIYFLLKSLLHLKDNGYLNVIIYDSWLYSDFGEYIKKILVENFNIEKVIHFKHDAFENAIVGATIILISNKKQTPFFEYYDYNSPEDVDLDNYNSDCKLMQISDIFNFNNNESVFDFSNDFFHMMEKISESPIKRGTSALVNKFFIFKDKCFEEYTLPFIKQVTNIPLFEANYTHYILNLPKTEMDEISNKNVRKYLMKIKKEVKEHPNDYKSLNERISKNEYWYHINPVKEGKILFNYYMRDNIHFILNTHNFLVSDNFYNIYITENILEYLSILNSNFTRYALLKESRNQGGKLFKIQLKQFNKVPIINLSFLSQESKEELFKLGEMLLKTERTESNEIILSIDNILIKEYNKHFNTSITRDILIKNIDKIKNGV